MQEPISEQWTHKLHIHFKYQLAPRRSRNTQPANNLGIIENQDEITARGDCLLKANEISNCEPLFPYLKCFKFFIFLVHHI